MALLEVFCNAFSTFLNHAEEINLWQAVAKLAALHTGEDGGVSVSKLQMDSSDGISREFMEIKAYGMRVRQEFSQSVGQRPENRDKNRYRDIVPFDKSRVVVDDTDSTYVNASLIEGLMSCCTYIAAQGPLPGQAYDFWRMVVWNKCPVIIMLCDLIEAGRSKCTKYWPDEIGKPETYGTTIIVTLLSEEPAFPPSPNSNNRQPCVYTPISRLFEIRTVGNDGKPLITRCRQYQMNGWPDHGVPPLSAVTSLIDLTSLLIHIYPPSLSQDNENAPLLVHCSAGCGRTGVFIGLHQVSVLLKLRQLDSNVLSTGLLELVKSLRYQRPSMVQTFEQYVFLYQLVATLMRRVSRSCLRRLVKMGVSVGDAEPPENVASNSPSPPPPKPPDPFGGSNNSLSRQQKLIIQQPLKPMVSVPSGRLFVAEIASDIVVVHRTGDWATLRRVSRQLAESIPRSVQQIQVISSPKVPASTQQKPATLQRRASTAETPSVMRRSGIAATPTVIFPGKSTVSQIVQIGSPQKPGLIGYPVSSTNPAPFPVSAPFSVYHQQEVDSAELARLEGVEKELAQLVSSVEKLASSASDMSSPISPRANRQRGMHRRQLSGSYDNINEVVNGEINGDVMSASLAVDTNGQAFINNNGPLHDRIVVDLSNISPPYQNMISRQEGGKSPAFVAPHPQVSHPQVSHPQVSPPPPLAPPRRRKKEPPQEHHLSVAHLVLNPPPNEATDTTTNKDVLVESATLGRHSSQQRSTVPYSGNAMGLKFVRNNTPAMINGLGRPLQRQSSLILHNQPNLHFNSHYMNNNNHQQQPHISHPALKQSVSQLPTSGLPDVTNDNNPYASLGRFRSVAHLGQVPPSASATSYSLYPPMMGNNNLNHQQQQRASLDTYPNSMPTTPSSIPNQPTSGRSI